MTSNKKEMGELERRIRKVIAKAHKLYGESPLLMSWQRDLLADAEEMWGEFPICSECYFFEINDINEGECDLDLKHEQICPKNIWKKKWSVK